jgi:uncharacterized protein YndB with AHSA1/START domain
MPNNSTFPSERELVLDRLIDASRANVYRCWTEPALLVQWFAPKPFTVPEAVLDVRPGGASRIVMQNPDGLKFPNEGVYLEVVPNERLVFTDAFTSGWSPKEGPPFMVAIIALSDENGKTRYEARVRHWTAEARVQHEEMGFHKGWGQCADQLEALAKTL